MQVSGSRVYVLAVSYELSCFYFREFRFQFYFLGLSNDKHDLLIYSILAGVPGVARVIEIASSLPYT